uniref:NADH-ubiquinone oxidoreductase chain 2 n=1 Tax=Colochirus quadrangularis TaxID=1980634 RepID=A0A7G7MWM8_9ECHN|nr:NADH dehydrogenase subunit 2 [Colochirus quadrangularis]QNG57237.1 NADH dehydrogenase subunit 2 [Colochirus quadrangularis]
MNNIILWFLSLSLISGTTIVILSNHWFSIWIGLELSTISVIPLLNTNNTPRSNEATLKYFLIQAFSASILLIGATLNLWLSNSWNVNDMLNPPICNTIILSAIIIKLGIAPGHFWFPDIISGIPFLNSTIIACWQKIAPFFILSLINLNSPNEITLFSATISILIGGWGGLNQTSIRKILAYSSIGQLGWITATSFYSPETALALLTFYLLINTSIFLICHNSNIPYISNLNKTNIIPTSSILIPLTLFSIGGLPPFGGFINKLIPFNILIINNNLIIIPLLILGSLLSLFYYIRIIINTNLIIFPNNSINIILLNTELSNTLNIIISILTPLSIIGIFLIPIISIFS